MKKSEVTAGIARGAAKAPRISHGSALSVLVTIIGEFMLPSHRPTWTSTLLYALAGVGIMEKSARQAIARAKTSGWIESDRDGRRAAWRLTERGQHWLTEGSRRVHALRDDIAYWNGDWVVLHMTLPDSRRSERLGLYQKLNWMGFGNPTPALWICPHVTRAEALRKAVEEMGLASNSITFKAQSLGVGISEQQLVAQAWDLEKVAQHYQALVDRFCHLRPRTDDAVFFAQIELLNSLMRLPWIDPGLPMSLLPAGWPGTGAATRLWELRLKWRPTAHAHWQAISRGNG